MKKQNAFTLIEILIYTGIFAIVGGMLTGILINATKVEQRESASAEVTSQLNFVMQTIQRLVRESSNIEIEAGTATSTLKLRMRDSAKDPTYITLSNDAIKLQEGSSATTTLTSDKVTVNTLSFKKFTQYPGHDTVSIDLTLTYNTQNTAGQVQRTLSSAIARVSAATFDADILPGADNTYSIGFNPSTRWKDGTFAGNLTVNGNVGIGVTSPLGKLNVRSGASGAASAIAEGDDLVVENNADVGLSILSPDANRQYIFFGTPTDNQRAYIKYIGLSFATVTDRDKMIFRTNTQDRMAIDSSGNIGIGTTTPASTLTVVGTIESTSGGFKFPDATTQTSAASGNPMGYISGLILSNDGTDATNDIDIAAGTARNSDNTADMTLTSTLIKQLDAAWAVGTNQGGLDTGTIANTTYHVWLIKRSDTGVVDALFSTSATAPTMPANYDKKRRIGSILRESAAIVAFVQDGDYFQRSVPINSYNTLNPGTAAVTITANTPTGLTLVAIVGARISTGASGPAVLVTDLATTDTAPSTTVNNFDAACGAANCYSGITVQVRTNTSAQFRYRGDYSDASMRVVFTTMGWIDTRGKDN